jgi:uncharacterized protein (DUF1778 family)
VWAKLSTPIGPAPSPWGLTAPYTVRTPTLVRTERLELRLTHDKRSLETAGASAVGETLSDCFRRAARTRAEEVLADQRDIVLTEEDARRFLDALETPDPDTVARLRELRDRA